MRKFLIIISIFISFASFAQNDFSTQIQKVADTLSKKIIASGKKKIALTEFSNLDGSVTQLGQFLSDELSSELSNLSGNLTKFEIIERSNLELIFKEKNLIQSVDEVKLAKDLGKLNAADVLIWAIISDFEGYYRVNIKMLDTKTGNSLGSYKTQFIKTSALENFNNKSIKKQSAVDTYIPKQFETKESDKVSNSPCEQDKTGTLSITNKTYSSPYDVSKIVVRIPKSYNSTGSNENDYYYSTLDKDENKIVANLKVGTYEYEAKKYDSYSQRGWNPLVGSISTGQIQIIKCKPTELIIR